MLEKNKLYCMDVFDFLDKIDDGSINLAIIDPPYNMKEADWDTFESEEEFLEFTYKWIDELIPKLKENDSSLYIFNTPYHCALILKYLLDKGLTFKNWITWDKRDGFTYTKKKYVNAQETILFFTKGENYTFNADNIRMPYESKERMKYAKQRGILKSDGERWYPNPNGKLCTDVWHISSERHKSKINGKIQKLFHITPKPLDMIERMIKASSKEGDLILDCFIGSGTTALACENLNRDFIGCDNNEEYIKLANERLKDENLKIINFL